MATEYDILLAAAKRLRHNRSERGAGHRVTDVVADAIGDCLTDLAEVARLTAPDDVAATIGRGDLRTAADVAEQLEASARGLRRLIRDREGVVSVR